MNPLANLQNFNIAGNAQNALLQGMQTGEALRQRKEQREREVALDNAYRGVYQGDPNAVNALAAIPGMGKDAYTLQQEVNTAQQQQMEAQQKRQREELQILSRILDPKKVVDEQSYQMARQAASQYGIDVSKAPPNYDPNWVAQNSAIATAIANDDPELPLIAQELIAAGLQPGTPQFQAEAGRILKAKYDTTKTLSYQQGGGAVAYDAASGQITPLIVPGGVEQGTPSIPPQAISDLRANPGTAAQFDEIFGKGAAAKALGGGQAANPPATFPGWF